MRTGPSTVEDGAFLKCGWTIFIPLWSSPRFHSAFLSSLALAFPALDGIILLESLGLPACLPLSLSWTLFPPVSTIPQSLSLFVCLSLLVSPSLHMRPYYSLSPSCSLSLPPRATWTFHFLSLTRPPLGLILLQSSWTSTDRRDQELICAYQRKVRDYSTIERKIKRVSSGFSFLSSSVLARPLASYLSPWMTTHGSTVLRDAPRMRKGILGYWFVRYIHLYFSFPCIFISSPPPLP